MKGRRSRVEREKRVKRSIVDQMKFMTIYDVAEDRMDDEEYVKIDESDREEEKQARNEKPVIKIARRPRVESQSQLHELMTLVQKKAGIINESSTSEHFKAVSADQYRIQFTTIL